MMRRLAVEVARMEAAIERFGPPPDDRVPVTFPTANAHGI
jgi:hypothetical protein